MKSYKIIDLFEEASSLQPKTISNEMIRMKRILDVESKIKTLRDSKVILPDYLDLFEHLENDKKNILANNLLQILSYISSTTKAHGALDRFRKGKIKSFDEKSSSLSALHQEARILLKYFKAQKELNEKLNDTSKISRHNPLKKLQADENREGLINDKITLRLDSFFQQLKETKAIIAAIGIK